MLVDRTGGQQRVAFELLQPRCDLAGRDRGGGPSAEAGHDPCPRRASALLRRLVRPQQHRPVVVDGAALDPDDAHPVAKPRFGDLLEADDAIPLALLLLALLGLLRVVVGEHAWNERKRGVFAQMPLRGAAAALHPAAMAGASPLAGGISLALLDPRRPKASLHLLAISPPLRVVDGSGVALDDELGGGALSGHWRLLGRSLSQNVFRRRPRPATQR